MRQHEEVQHRHRAGCRLCTVVVLFHAQQHRAVTPGRAEPSAVGVVPEELVLTPLQQLGPVEPCRIGIGLKELQQAEDEIRVVLGVGLDARLAAAVAAQERAGLMAPHAPADERCGTAGGGEIRRGVLSVGANHPRGARESGNHQPVPGCQHLVVEVRVRPPNARLEHLQPRSVECGLDLLRRPGQFLRDVLDRSRDVEQVLAREFLLRIDRRVAVILNAEPPSNDGLVCAEKRGQLAGRHR